MRRLNIARPAQLRLDPFDAPGPSEVWAGVPEVAKGQIVVLLARLVARGVVAGGHEEEIM